MVWMPKIALPTAKNTRMNVPAASATSFLPTMRSLLPGWTCGFRMRRYADLDRLDSPARGDLRPPVGGPLHGMTRSTAETEHGRRRGGALMAGEFTLHPQGDIDVATVEQQRGQWLEALEQRRPQRLVIDMTDVAFLDSTGLGAVVGLQRPPRAHRGAVARAHRGVVAIPNAAPPVQQVLQLTGMHLTMEVNGTAPAAPEG